jgi:hypothetical protein
MKSRTGDGAAVCVVAASTVVIARTSWGLGSSLVARCARASMAAPNSLAAQVVKLHQSTEDLVALIDVGDRL